MTMLTQFFNTTYGYRNGRKGLGPSTKRHIVHCIKPQTIINQWFTHLSASQPHIGLNIPYRAEKSKNIKPILSGVRSN